jgi:hypothetical protein
VCNDRVVGFGHPLNFMGRSTAMLMPADALYVQEDPTLVPFKVANLGAAVGTITDDHLTGITGTLGALPVTAPITSTVTFGERSRTGSSVVSVPRALPVVTLFELWANHDRALDAIQGGSELQKWNVKGHDGAGKTFSLTVTDRFASSDDIGSQGAFDVLDAVGTLQTLSGVTLDSVTTDGVVTEDASTYRITSLQQRRAGVWHTVTKASPATVRAGGTLNLRIRVSTDSVGTYVPVQVQVPKRAAGSRGRLSLIGGADLFDETGPGSSLGSTLKYFRTVTRNDEIAVGLSLEGPTRSFTVTDTAGPADKVVTGDRSFPVRIK